MKKILLVYLPFCTPASPPYSITYLNAFLKENCDADVEVLDFNLEFHKWKFPEYQQYFQNMEWEDYEEVVKKYKKLTKEVYSENTNKVVKGEKPEFFDEFLNEIRSKKPDIVAFSIVYSSQAFYAYALLKELKDFVSVIGGPAVSEKLIKLADKSLNNEIEFLDFIKTKKTDNINFKFPLDFSIYDLNEYFVPKPVIPIKTSNSCPYRKCSFCSHYNKTPYLEYDLEVIKKTIINSKQKYFFLIDDMIPVKRLLEIARVLKPLNVFWTCQLKPTKELSYEVLKELKESGLKMLMFGVESGCDRILNLIDKGTNKKDIENVLKNSHLAGIKNVAYILFGFPSETKNEFLETIEFLKKNEKNIDLVSGSIFGLQKDTKVYNNFKDFGIKKILEEERTVLDKKITYEVNKGLSSEQVNKLRANYKETINKINKFPKTMNFFREHMLLIS